MSETLEKTRERVSKAFRVATTNLSHDRVSLAKDVLCDYINKLETENATLTAALEAAKKESYAAGQHAERVQWRALYIAASKMYPRDEVSLALKDALEALDGGTYSAELAGDSGRDSPVPPDSKGG